MKGFETYLRKCIRREWSEHYVDYGLLKDMLRSFHTRRVQLRHAIGRDESMAVNDFIELSGAEDLGEIMPKGYFQCVDALNCYEGCGESLIATENIDIVKARYSLSALERKEFSSLLEQHIKSAGLFYCNTLLPQIQQHIENQEYDEASRALLETMSFACTNILAFRQLVIRYEAFAITFEGIPLSAAYLQAEDAQGQGMFELERADELEKQIMSGLQIKEDELEAGQRNVMSRDGNTFAEQVQKFHALLHITDEKVSQAAVGEYRFRVLMIQLQRSESIDYITMAPIYSSIVLL